MVLFRGVSSASLPWKWQYILGIEIINPKTFMAKKERETPLDSRPGRAISYS
jgi:hypothetical protein